MSAAASVAMVAVVGVGGWLALRSFDDSMAGVWVTEDTDEAARIAEAMGVALNGSEVAYGEVTSQFQGWPMAYLVVTTESPASRDQVIEQSRLRCRATDPAVVASLRSPADHGPRPSPSLLTCTRPTGDADTTPAGEHRGDLTVWFDPTSGDRSTWLYISAVG